MEKEFKKEEAKNILQKSGMQTARPVPLPPTYKFAQDCGAAKYWITVKKGAILKGKGNPI